MRDKENQKRVDSPVTTEGASPSLLIALERALTQRGCSVEWKEHRNRNLLFEIRMDGRLARVILVAGPRPSLSSGQSRPAALRVNVGQATQTPTMWGWRVRLPEGESRTQPVFVLTAASSQGASVVVSIPRSYQWRSEEDLAEHLSVLITNATKRARRLLNGSDLQRKCRQREPMLTLTPRSERDQPNAAHTQLVASGALLLLAVAVFAPGLVPTVGERRTTVLTLSLALIVARVWWRPALATMTKVAVEGSLAAMTVGVALAAGPLVTHLVYGGLALMYGIGLAVPYLLKQGSENDEQHDRKASALHEWLERLKSMSWFENTKLTEDQTKAPKNRVVFNTSFNTSQVLESKQMAFRIEEQGTEPIDITLTACSTRWTGTSLASLSILPERWVSLTLRSKDIEHTYRMAGMHGEALVCEGKVGWAIAGFEPDTAVLDQIGRLLELRRRPGSPYRD